MIAYFSCGWIICLAVGRMLCSDGECAVKCQDGLQHGAVDQGLQWMHTYKGGRGLLSYSAIKISRLIDRGSVYLALCKLSKLMKIAMYLVYYWRNKKLNYI